MSHLGLGVATFFREFERAFKLDGWKVYPSSTIGASLIEDKSTNKFYVIFGSDSDYKPINLKRLEKTLMRFSKYKGKQIHQLLYLAHCFSKKAVRAISEGKLQNLKLIEFDINDNRVNLISDLRDIVLALELEVFILEYMTEVKNGYRERIAPKSESVKRKPIKYSLKEPEIMDNYPSSIRILAFSDWRIQNVEDVNLFLKKHSPFDLLVYAGDDIVRFWEHGIKHFTIMIPYIKTGYIVAVLGNDDEYDYTKRILKDQNVLNLYERSLVIGDYAFIGLESSTSGPAIFLHSEDDFEKQLAIQSRKVKGKKIILVSHTPPFGVLDTGIRFASKEEGIQNIGSTSLRDFLMKQNVEAIICGHCHSKGGMSQELKGSKIINVASHDNQGSVGRFAIIMLSSTGVDVEWHDTDELLPESSVIRVYGIRDGYKKMLEKAHITTIQQLANIENINEIEELTGIYSKLLWKFKFAAQSMLNKETYQLKPFQIPNEKLIFVDIETDLACERVWLIGLLIEGKFIQLYAESWDKEREILEKFIDILQTYRDYSLVSYSGTNFDFRISLNAMRRHGLEAEFINAHPHFDLCNEMRNCFTFPLRSFRLKDLGSYQGYSFKHNEFDGMWVAEQYHIHVNTGSPIDLRVFEYNEDDVRAVQFLYLKCQSLNSRN